MCNDKRSKFSVRDFVIPKRVFLVHGDEFRHEQVLLTPTPPLHPPWLASSVNKVSLVKEKGAILCRTPKQITSIIRNLAKEINFSVEWVFFGFRTTIAKTHSNH